jgi:hypothetical protein
MRRSKLVFHPLSVLVCAGLGIFLYIVWMRRQHPGGDLSQNFFYVLPIIVPFVAFVFDRARRFPRAALIELAIDSAVVVTAMMRVIGDVPFVSGHALFLTYAIRRPGSRLTRITAAIVMIQVIYLKLFVWHDVVTPLTGIILGLLAAFVVRRFTRGMIPSLTPLPDIQ